MVVVVVLVMAMEIAVVVMVRHAIKICSIFKGLYDHADLVAALAIILCSGGGDKSRNWY